MLKSKILIVEDEPSLGQILLEAFEFRGFNAALVADGSLVMDKYRSWQPDLIIMDMMLPGENGLDLTSSIRFQDRRTPILFLTARSMPDDVLDGFRAGGNDYMKKPFDLQELVVRVQVLLSSDRLLVDTAASPGQAVQIGEYQFQVMQRLLTRNGVSKKLTGREADALATLYQYRNRDLSRDSLLKKVWGDNTFFNSRSLDVYISRLRRYLKDDPEVQIINNRGFGYRLVC